MSPHLPPDPDVWEVMTAVLSVIPWDDAGPGEMVCRHCHGKISDPQPHKVTCAYAIMWLMVEDRCHQMRRWADEERAKADRMRSQFGQLSENIGWNR